MQTPNRSAVSLAVIATRSKSECGFWAEAAPNQLRRSAKTHQELWAKPIEDVVIGDKVWARDKASGEVVSRPVVRLFRHAPKPIVSVVMTSGVGGQQSVSATTEHPFWVPTRGWVAASSLQAGDKLLSKVGEKIVVDRVETCSRHERVFNFEVELEHNYFVGTRGVLVHNDSTPTMRKRYLVLDNDGTMKGVRDKNAYGRLEFIIGWGFEQEFDDNGVPVLVHNETGVRAKWVKVKNEDGKVSECYFDSNGIAIDRQMYKHVETNVPKAVPEQYAPKPGQTFYSKEAAEALHQILEDDGDAVIVIGSSWGQLGLTRDGAAGLLRHHVSELAASRLAEGDAWVLPGDAQQQRYEAVREHAKNFNNGKVDDYIALDDKMSAGVYKGTDMEADGRVIWADATKGLTAKDVQTYARVRDKLNERWAKEALVPIRLVRNDSDLATEGLMESESDFSDVAREVAAATGNWERLEEGAFIDPAKHASPWEVSIDLTQPNREVFNLRELKETLALRRVGFSEKLDVDGKQLGPYEADAYDSYSVHYVSVDSSGRAIGTLRAVTTVLQPRAAAMLDWVLGGVNDPVVAQRVSSPRHSELPSVFDPALVASLNPSGKPGVELGRFVVDPEYRGSAVARTLGDVGFAHAAESNVFGIASSAPENIPLYLRSFRKYGLEVVGGARTPMKFRYAGFDVDSVFYHWNGGVNVVTSTGLVSRI